MHNKLFIAFLFICSISFVNAYPDEIPYHPDTADVVISSFESGMDGWVVQGAGNSATAGVYSTGATDGFYSLKLDTPDSWWNEALMIDLGTIEGGKDALFGNNTLSMDVSWLGSEWVTANTGWTQAPTIMLLVNPDMGWAGNWWNSGNSNVGVTAGTWAEGVYTPGPDGQATLSFDYQAIASGYINSASTQYKLILQIVHSQWTQPCPLYIDNVKLSGAGYVEWILPEPATIALLGLGGLALRRRKR